MEDYSDDGDGDILRRNLSYNPKSEPDLYSRHHEQDEMEQEWQHAANARSDEPIPAAPRPAWLPSKGCKQSDVAPVRWAMTIEQWLFFVQACMATETWTVLAGHLGDRYKINMYHLNEHFVVPWTRDTGSSIALLMNSEPCPVELMISHAWAGSVVESFAALRNAIYQEEVPSGTAIFFCTLSMYQPEDGAGPSISEQLALNPFADIIHCLAPSSCAWCIRRPTKSIGMRVLHTTVYEVYQRLWTVHEVDEALIAGIHIAGLTDFHRFQIGSLSQALHINTSSAECREEDRPMLHDKIMKRGGYERLDAKIVKVRQGMALAFKARYIVPDGELHERMEGMNDVAFESWNMEKEDEYRAWWQACLEGVQKELVSSSGLSDLNLGPQTMMHGSVGLNSFY